MRRVQVRRPVCFLALLWLALYTDYTGLVRIGLLSALLHELGHVLVWMLLTHSLPVLRFSAVGIGLDTSGQRLSFGQTFWLAAAGPAMNLLLCGGTLLAMEHRASYWGCFFAAANFALAVFNLLPLGFLDGCQMWRAAISWGLHLHHK